MAAIVGCGMSGAYSYRVRDALLRGAGVLLLACGVLAMRGLFGAGHHDPSAGAFLVAALGFLCLSAGSALAWLGAHLFDPIALSDRWARRPTAPPEESASPATFRLLLEEDVRVRIARGAARKGEVEIVSR